MGCDLADYPKLPGIIFGLMENGEPNHNGRLYKDRFEELKKAKKMC